jgi:hypothetical protein
MQAIFVRLSGVENRIAENRVTYCIIGDWGIKRLLGINPSLIVFTQMTINAADRIR